MKYVLILISCLLIGTVTAQVPKGVVYLPNGQSLDATALARADGVVVGGVWSDLEPTEGNYVFNSCAAPGCQSLDTQVAAATAAGKWMRLTIAASPRFHPSWMAAKIAGDSYAGGKYFTWKAATCTTYPVPWEPTVLTKKSLLAHAVAAHFSGNSLIKVVFVEFAGMVNEDWNPGSISPAPDGCGGAGNAKQRWLDTITGSPYASFQAAFTDAGNQMMAAYRDAFGPTMYLKFSIGRIGDTALNPGSTPTNFGRNIAFDVILAANAAFPGRVLAMKENLNGGGVPAAPGIGNAWNDLYELSLLGIPIVAQATWNCYADSGCSPNNYLCSRMNYGLASPCLDSTRMLKQSVDTAVSYSVQYYEIYEQDFLFLNSGNADPDPLWTGFDAISYAHNTLNAPIQTPTGFSFF